VPVVDCNILPMPNFRMAKELQRGIRAQGTKLLQEEAFVRASWLLGCVLAAGMAT